MRPPFDGIPPPEPWSPEMQDWIDGCKDRSEITLFDYHQKSPVDQIVSSLRETFWDLVDVGLAAKIASKNHRIQ